VWSGESCFNKYSSLQLREYLDNPPQGIDPKLWRQAQLDNPDPKSFIPVPMIGFKALQARIKCQDTLAKCQVTEMKKTNQYNFLELVYCSKEDLSLSLKTFLVYKKLNKNLVRSR